MHNSIIVTTQENQMQKPLEIYIWRYFNDANQQPRDYLCHSVDSKRILFISRIMIRTRANRHQHSTSKINFNALRFSKETNRKIRKMLKQNESLCVMQFSFLFHQNMAINFRINEQWERSLCPRMNASYVIHEFKK